MKVCLVALAIGDKYLEVYTHLFRKSHEMYAKKHGYDFRVETDYLEPSYRDKSVCSLNKILVCSQPWSSQYDFIVFIDSDIYINITAPPIHSCIDFGDKIGIIDEYEHLVGYEEYTGLIGRILEWGVNPPHYYAKAGLQIYTKHILNTGVLVMQPAKHSSFLREVFDKHVMTCITHPRKFHYEQAAIGYELQTQSMFTILPKKFNAVWYIQKIINEEERIKDLKRRKEKNLIMYTIQRHIKSDLYETAEKCINKIRPFFINNYFIHLAGQQNYERVFEFEQINIELSNNDIQSQSRS
jgi:hypothetical protein